MIVPWVARLLALSLSGLSSSCSRPDSEASSALADFQELEAALSRIQYHRGSKKGDAGYNAARIAREGNRAADRLVPDRAGFYAWRALRWNVGGALKLVLVDHPTGIHIGGSNDYLFHVLDAEARHSRTTRIEMANREIILHVSLARWPGHDGLLLKVDAGNVMLQDPAIERSYYYGLVEDSLRRVAEERPK